MVGSAAPIVCLVDYSWVPACSPQYLVLGKVPPHRATAVFRKLVPSRRQAYFQSGAWVWQRYCISFLDERRFFDEAVFRTICAVLHDAIALTRSPTVLASLARGLILMLALMASVHHN